MGFLVESYLDENGNITMNACFFDFIMHNGYLCCKTTRHQITEDTIESLSNDLRLSKWKKNNIYKNNFKLFFEGSFPFGDIHNHTILSERDKRLYCVENSEWRSNNVLYFIMQEYFEPDFVIHNKSNNRYHYFESLDSFEELFLIVLGSFGYVADYPMK